MDNVTKEPHDLIWKNNKHILYQAIYRTNECLVDVTNIAEQEVYLPYNNSTFTTSIRPDQMNTNGCLSLLVRWIYPAKCVRVLLSFQRQYLKVITYPGKHRRKNNAGVILGQRHKRWPSIEQEK